MPAKLIPQGKYALEVWLDILIDKYQQHMPIQRQIFAMRQYDVTMIPGTVFGGLKTIFGIYLKPLYEEFIIELRNGIRWHADETRWYMLSDAMKKLWYMWGFKSEDVTVFVLDATRSASVPAKANIRSKLNGIFTRTSSIPSKATASGRNDVSSLMERPGERSIPKCSWGTNTMLP